MCRDHGTFPESKKECGIIIKILTVCRNESLTITKYTNYLAMSDLINLNDSKAVSETDLLICGSYLNPVMAF